MQVQRARANIALIDNALGGGLPRGSTILFFGPSEIKKGMIAAQIMHERLKAGDTGLMVLTEESPERMKSRYADHGWDFSKFESSGYLKYVDAYTKSVGGNVTDNGITEFVENPQSLIEISIAVTEMNEALWNISPDVINVFDSGSRALAQTNVAAAINHLIVLMNKIKETRAMFIITMEEKMHDDMVVAAVRHSMDVIVDFKIEGKNTMFKISGKDVVTTDWMVCHFTPKGFQ